MKNVKRFALECNEEHFFEDSYDVWSMGEDSTGDFVKFEDYRQLAAQNAELARENASLKSSLTRSYEANDHLNDQYKDLAVMKHTRFNNEECWIFDEDNLEENHLESLVCPVVIRARKLREILDKNAEVGRAGFVAGFVAGFIYALGEADEHDVEAAEFNGKQYSERVKAGKE